MCDATVRQDLLEHMAMVNVESEIRQHGVRHESDGM